jgi:Family of unknown function (DUF5995)
VDLIVAGAWHAALVRDRVAALLARMEADLARLRDEGDARRYFHATYLRTTRAVAEEIDRGGFLDGEWLERWDLVFAELYLDALDASLRGAPVSAPWRIAFDAARDRDDLPPVRHVLLGMNAHINYDLPQALVAAISPEEFDDAQLLARRAADHRHVDDVLISRVGAEDTELEALTPRTLVDRLLAPLNRAASRRILTEAREKVWHNAVLLDRARRTGPQRRAEVLAALEQASAAKLAELIRPGQVLLRLARHGFGVRLAQ